MSIVELREGGIDREYERALERSIDRERADASERAARHARDCSHAYRRGMLDGILLAGFVVACVGAVLGVFLAALLNGGGA